MQYIHWSLVREHQLALLAEAAHDRLINKARPGPHSARPRTRGSSLKHALHRASTALRFAGLTDIR